MVNQSLTAEDPDTCSCFSKPQECLLTFAKTSLQVLDIYLLFFGMILTIIIGIQWTSTGLFLGKLQMHHVCTGLLFLTFGLQQTSETIYTGLKSYKAIIWSILAILFIIPSLGIQTTKTIHFATLSDENISTLHSHVQANVSAIGPTEFAMGLEVFFGVPASFASGIILVRTEETEKHSSSFCFNSFLDHLCLFPTLVTSVTSVPVGLGLSKIVWFIFWAEGGN